MEDLVNSIQQDSSVEVADIQFRPGQKVYYFDPDGLECHAGDHVIIDTARGVEFGYCAGGNHRIPERDVVSPLRKVLRRATAQDEQTAEQNRAREKKAYDLCVDRIAARELDMQLVAVECAFDGSKILFHFTADERVDFRELVKDLASAFHTRIELRQIGVRDKARMVGGLGICGRPFCCAEFLADFQPVSIKMAKTQNLSLNPTKISGTCGRLMCCLKYEQSTYEELIRTSPREESLVDTPDGRGTVTETDIFRQRVKVRLDADPDKINVYSNEDIAVLRNGKGKKSDAPIPDDYAPISGTAVRQARQDKPKEQEPRQEVLESIRFRYSTETIADERPLNPANEQEQLPQPEAAAQEPGKEENRNRRRGRRPQNGGRSTDDRKSKQPGNNDAEEQKTRGQSEHRSGQRQDRENGGKTPADKITRENTAGAGAPEEAGSAEGKRSRGNGRRPAYRRHRKTGEGKQTPQE